MSPEQTRHLFDTFPRLYRGKDESIKTNLIPFGFDCGSGWYNILFLLSKKIDACCKDLDDDQYPKALQVKEKWGTLRFYVGGGTDKIYDYIDMAEQMSAVTCEECGWLGKTRDTRWVRTLCEDCHQCQ